MFYCEIIEGNCTLGHPFSFRAGNTPPQTHFRAHAPQDDATRTGHQGSQKSHNSCQTRVFKYASRIMARKVREELRRPDKPSIL